MIAKEDFINILCSLSVTEINEIIKQKGKPPKPIRPILVIRDLPRNKQINKS